MRVLIFDNSFYTPKSQADVGETSVGHCSISVLCLSEKCGQ